MESQPQNPDLEKILKTFTHGIIDHPIMIINKKDGRFHPA